MKLKSHPSDYHRKLIDAINYYLKDFKKPNILEFGVKTGISTRYFLDLCKKKNGKLVSVDIDNYENLFKSKRWKFIHTSDDNYDLIKKYLPKKIDIIHLDSFHQADHVAKIFYLYYHKLKPGGIFLIDDISCLPYIKGMKKNSFGNEIANQETFEIILDIYFHNKSNFDLSFSFTNTGLAIIRKLRSNQLNSFRKINYRKNSLKNFGRKFVKPFRN
ncbi:class I SAM-dependent methyltransferase [Candidatus Pelagibacter communis]|uniref:class I SAM-dependent methyltransferase n=1 Tax=Pelagibacter ubique TaxID=198252 RepID=UPI00094D291C|nr:class I SAM-dependent methyltransferase [Candidatus Pelagibacter ubique]